MDFVNISRDCVEQQWATASSGSFAFLRVQCSKQYKYQHIVS